MLDYKRIKIFKILDHMGDILDIGYTIQSLRKYFNKCKYYHKCNKIVLIEDYPCNNIEQVNQRIHYHIEREFNEMNNKAELSTLQLVWSRD